MTNARAAMATAALGVTARVVTQLAALLVTLVAARYLGPTEFGVFAIASAVTTYVRTTLYSGPYEHFLKTDRPDAFSTETLLATLGIAIALSAITCALFAFSESVFESAMVGVLVWQLAPSNILSAIAAWQEAHVLRSSRLGAYYVVMLCSEVFAGLVAVALLLYGFGFGALVVQIYLRAVVNLLGYALLRSTTWSDRVSWLKMREIFAWATPRYGEISLSFFAQYGADFLLGAFLSPAAAGTYRAASRVCGAVSDLVLQPLRVLALTQFSRRAARNADVGALIAPVSRVVGLTSWVSLAMFAAVAGVLVPLLLGQQWRESGQVAPVLCLAMALMAQTSIVTAALVASNRQRQTLKLRFVATLILIGGVCAIASLGPLAAAGAVAFAALCSMALFMNEARLTFAGAWPRVMRAMLLNVAIAAAVGVTTAGVLHLLRDTELNTIAALAIAMAAGGACALVATALSYRSISRAMRTV